MSEYYRYYMVAMVPLLLCVLAAPPSLASLSSWLAGAGEAAEAQGRVFQPVPSSSLAQPEPEASTAVYNRTGGWLEPAASPFLYLLGHQVRCQPRDV